MPYIPHLLFRVKREVDCSIERIVSIILLYYSCKSAWSTLFIIHRVEYLTLVVAVKSCSDNVSRMCFKCSSPTQPTFSCRRSVRSSRCCWKSKWTPARESLTSTGTWSCKRTWRRRPGMCSETACLFVVLYCLVFVNYIISIYFVVAKNLESIAIVLKN